MAILATTSLKDMRILRPHRRRNDARQKTGDRGRDRCGGCDDGVDARREFDRRSCRPSRTRLHSFTPVRSQTSLTATAHPCRSHRHQDGRLFDDRIGLWRRHRCRKVQHQMPLQRAEADACVIVATIRALKSHSGKYRIVAGKALPPEMLENNVGDVEAGASNLRKQIENIRLHGVTPSSRSMRLKPTIPKRSRRSSVSRSSRRSWSRSVDPLGRRRKTPSSLPNLLSLRPISPASSSFFTTSTCRSSPR